MPSQKGPVWFKFFGKYQSMLEGFPRESVGEGLILTVNYFNNRELPDTSDPYAYAVFMTLKADVDEAFDDYDEAVSNGKTGASLRHKKSPDSYPPLAPLSPP